MDGRSDVDGSGIDVATMTSVNKSLWLGSETFRIAKAINANEAPP